MKAVADNFTNVYFRIFLLLLGFPLVAQAGDVDFSNYDVPLYTQIVDTIKAKIAPRLGEGTLTRMRKYKNREFEAFTISWLPRDFLTNPHLCVFDGPGARLFPKQNKCPISPGRNFTLAETIKLAVDAKNAVAMWGPYEIRKEAFNRAVARKRLLDQGKIKYRADDRLYRQDKVAISCFHAMAGLDELFPNGGLFGTGFMMWGFNGTARVLIEYTEKASNKGLLLDPVDVKNDRFVFVYAPTAGGAVPYNPAKSAVAYHR